MKISLDYIQYLISFQLQNEKKVAVLLYQQLQNSAPHNKHNKNCIHLDCIWVNIKTYEISLHFFVHLWKLAMIIKMNEIKNFVVKQLIICRIIKRS